MTHYCACSLCCGTNADGFTASGKRAASGMVAMSSYYPFGTQIMINGVLLGVNRHNNSLCIVDLFNTKINKNAKDDTNGPRESALYHPHPFFKWGENAAGSYDGYGWV